MGSPPIIINETILTLEHVMQMLDTIEKKMLTKEHIKFLDKRIHDLANRIGSKIGDTLEVLMTHKYRGLIVGLSISKSAEPNEERKEMTSGFQQGNFFKH